jgi:hypothetical protein
MADLTAGQIPKYANVPNGGVGAIVGSANTVTLGSDTNGATIYTAGAQGGRVYSLLGNTDDTVAVNVLLYILNGSSVSPLGIVNVPLSSGNASSTLNVNMLDSTVLKGLPVDAAGNRYIPLMPSEVLKCGALANLTATKTCWVTAIGSDYQA